MRFKVQLGNQEQEVEVIRQGDQLRIVLGDQVTEVRVQHTDGAHFVLEYHDEQGLRRRLRAAGHRAGDQRQLWVNGSMVQYTRLRETGKGDSPAGAGSLSAAIPAVVSEILVQPGDLVAAGDKLILLESMKMILPIQAPTPGRVAAIHCQPGEAVQPGIPLVDLDPVE
ncbi:MAG: biotin attachment protein [Ardenticatenaceae bacterium]|nr:biotin attachment protein [Ardenticatenaceae bacterium]